MGKVKKTNKNQQEYDSIIQAALMKNKNLINDNIIDVVCKSLIEWVQDDNSLRIDQFLYSRKLTRSKFYNWLKIYPKLQEYFDMAIMAIANRRDIGAMTRKYDSHYISKTMGFYCQVHKDEHKREIELKQAADANTFAGIKVIKLPASLDLISDEYIEENKDRVESDKFLPKNMEK